MTQRPRRCELYPHCACKPQLEEWQRKLADDDRRWSFEELSYCDHSLWCTLNCLSRFCPDRNIRAYAQAQLLNPWFTRHQKFFRGERVYDELTLEECAEIVRRGKLS
jgi:hypothetical protein